MFCSNSPLLGSSHRQVDSISGNAGSTNRTQERVVSSADSPDWAPLPLTAPAAALSLNQPGDSGSRASRLRKRTGDRARLHMWLLGGLAFVTGIYVTALSFSTRCKKAALTHARELQQRRRVDAPQKKKNGISPSPCLHFSPQIKAASFLMIGCSLGSQKRQLVLAHSLRSARPAARYTESGHVSVTLLSGSEMACHHHKHVGF